MNRRALQVIEINVYAEAARAVRAALKKRDEGEREAAAILSKQERERRAGGLSAHPGGARESSYRSPAPPAPATVAQSDYLSPAEHRATSDCPEPRVL